MTLPPSLLAWWTARESREQKLLLVCGVFAVAAALYATVYPVLSMHAAASGAFQVADGNYHWLKQQVRVLTDLRSEAGGALPVSLSPGAAREKIEADLEKKAMQGKVALDNTDGAKRIKVMLEANDGRKVMRWLQELTNDGYTVSALSLKNKKGRLAGVVFIEV